MSKADEMFEKLGYKKNETINFISYRGKLDDRYAILFDKSDKSIIFERFNTIEILQLQAINQKVKELKWI